MFRTITKSFFLGILGLLFFGIVHSDPAPPSGSYIQNRSTLQPGNARFHVSSGTIEGQFQVQTIRFNDGTTQTTAGGGGGGSGINNQDTLQTGATFYVEKGTLNKSLRLNNNGTDTSYIDFAVPYADVSNEQSLSHYYYSPNGDDLFGTYYITASTIAPPTNSSDFQSIYKSEIQLSPGNGGDFPVYPSMLLNLNTDNPFYLSLNQNAAYLSNADLQILPSGQTTRGLVLVSTASTSTKIEASTYSTGQTIKLPPADGTNGQAVTTNGAGQWSFSTVGPNPTGANRVPFFNNSNTFTSSNNLCFHDSPYGTLGLGFCSSFAYAKIYTRNEGSYFAPPAVSATPSASEVADFNGPYFIGNQVQYKVFTFRTVNGQRVYSQSAVASNNVTITADNNSVNVTWSAPGGTFDGYKVWRAQGGSGFYTDSVLSDSNGTANTLYDSVDITWEGDDIETGVPSNPSFDMKYNYVPIAGIGDNNHAYGIYGGAGYFDSDVGISTIPTVGRPLTVVQNDANRDSAMVVQGYSAGGFGTKHTLQINNNNGQKVVGINGGNLYPADAGYIDLFGYPTSSFDNYQFGSVNYYNYSGEATGDLRMGIWDVIRDGSAYQATARIIVRNSSGGFYSPLHIKYSGLIGLGGGSVGVSNPLGTVHIIPPSSATKGLIVQGVASQSANIFELRTSANVITTTATVDGSWIVSTMTTTSAFYGVVPATQTVASGNTITANACGGIKLITNPSAVTTSTTDTFTAPSATNKGCEMFVINVGTSTITLDNNAKFKSAGGADIALTADDSVKVGSIGNIWYQLAPLVAN